MRSGTLDRTRTSEEALELLAAALGEVMLQDPPLADDRDGLYLCALEYLKSMPADLVGDALAGIIAGPVTRGEVPCACGHEQDEHVAYCSFSDEDGDCACLADAVPATDPQMHLPQRR